MKCCNAHENCSIISVKLPKFGRPQNLPLVEHILRLMVEDGFGEYAYFEALRDDPPTAAEEMEIVEKPRFASPAGNSTFEAAQDEWLVASGERTDFAQIAATAKALLRSLAALPQPRGSPSPAFTP
jgi:hypothetical protein